MLTSQGVILLVAAVSVVTLWASIGGVFMGLNVSYGGICWFGISLLVWAAYLSGFVASAASFSYVLPWSFDVGAILGVGFYTGLSVVGAWFGQKLVPLLSADVFGRGPVWRWRLQPNDYPLMWDKLVG